MRGPMHHHHQQQRQAEEGAGRQEETALTWLRRSRAARSRLSVPPADVAEFVRSSVASISSDEFFSVSGGGGGGGDGAADRMASRFEAGMRRRRRWREEQESRRRLRRRKVMRKDDGGAVPTDKAAASEEGTTAAGGEEASSDDVMSVLESVRRGTGLPFVDAALRASAGAVDAAHQPVLEITGRSGTGKTSLLLTLAANYAACTSWGCYVDESGHDCERSEGGCADVEGGESYDCYGAPFRHGRGGGIGIDENAIGGANGSDESGRPPGGGPATAKASSPPPVPPPIVVIIDTDLSIHATSLAGAVRTAVVRRWNETAAVRERIRERGRKEDRRGQTEEWDRVEREVTSILGRIHVVRPANFGTGAVSALESLRFSLDKAAELRALCKREEEEAEAAFSSSSSGAPPLGSGPPPVLLLIDSLTSHSAIDRRLERTSPGLSGRNEFVRQLVRLRNAHPCAVVAARSTYGGGAGGGGSAAANAFMGSPAPPLPGGGGTAPSSDPWSKLVTARLALERVVSGSREDVDGYDFVALVPRNRCIGGAVGAGGEAMMSSGVGFDVMPFSVTPGGVLG